MMGNTGLRENLLKFAGSRNMTIFVCHFVDPDLGFEKKGQQNKGILILKWRFRHLLHTSTRNLGKFQAEPIYFFFVIKKNSF